MQEFLSFEIFLHYKGFFLDNHCQTPRQRLKMTEGSCVGCESIMKYVCLKCVFACNISLKCSVPASENYPGWKEYTKRDTLQIINNKVPKRKKTKKWWKHQMMFNSFTALQGDFTNIEKSGRQSLEKNGTLNVTS